MKQGMTNVDVAALAAELRPLLTGGRFDKAYQPAKDQVLLRLRGPGVGRIDLLFEVGRYVTAVRRPPENPQTPSMVARILRSTFGNGRIRDVRQVGFDRLLRIDVERPEGTYAVVLELFGDGNLLLLGPDDTILLPLRGEDFAHRRLRKGEPYVPPPAGAHPLRLALPELVDLSAEAKKDLIRFLALDLGLGPQWAEEVCLRAGVDKKTLPADLDDAAWRAVHAVLQGIGADLERADLAPAVVHDAEGNAVDAVPWPMRKYPAPDFALEEAPTFREALDTYFRGAADEEDVDPRQARFDDARAKIQRQVDMMTQALDGFAHDEAEAQADAEALYASFQQVQKLLDDLAEARRTRSWQEIEAVLESGRTTGHQLAMQVPELKPHDGSAVFVVRDAEGQERRVRVDLRKSVQENAEVHYEKAKKARSRREGALKALEEARRRMADLEAKGLEGFGAAPKRAQAQKRHYWFEAYRWTVTPNGLLAVGGRNASQNDAVVKKYLRDGDRYVHAEIHGAPSVVLRPPEGPPADIASDDLVVACQFAACSSRAWRQFGAASAYWVTAQQVSKTPRSGEFVPKGAWIVHGKRNVVSDLGMAWAVGRVFFDRAGRPVRDPGPEHVEKLAGGPPAGIEAWGHDIVRFEPGDEDVNDVARRIAERYDQDIEDAQAVLPPGPVRVVQ